MESTGLTDSALPAAAARLLFGNGVSDALDLLKPELDLLTRTVAVNFTMLDEMTLLGYWLTSLNPNTAPVVNLRPGAQQGTIQEVEATREEQARTDPVDTRARADFTSQLRAQVPPYTETPTAAGVGVAPKPRFAVWDAAIASQREPMADMLPGNSSISAAPGLSEASEPEQRAAITWMPVSRTTASVAGARLSRADAPLRAPPPIGAQPSGKSFPSDPVLATLSAVAEPSTHFDDISLPVNRERLNPMALPYQDAAVTVPFGPGHAPDANRQATALLKPMRPQTDADGLPDIDTQPRQGVLILDGSRLGRWVIEHLERSASRMSAATTGIDPRMTPSYPGAPTGA